MLKLVKLARRWTGQRRSVPFNQTNGFSSLGVNQNYCDSRQRGEIFQDILNRRQGEATRSVVVQVDSDKHFVAAYQYCSQFGRFKNAFAYSFPKNRHFVLLEYETVDAVHEAFKYSGFQNDTVPWQNRFLSLQHEKINPSTLKAPTDSPELKFNSIFEPSSQHLIDVLQKADTIDDQMQILYENTRLDDLSIRLRFIGALQVQTVLSQFLNYLFPNTTIYPFGSTMNGFGKMGCDLDMALQLKGIERNTHVNKEAPLLFHGKQYESTEEARKIEGKLQVKCVGSMIDYFLPGVGNVLSLHRARVPIVRYYDTYVLTNVDLSLNNLDGFYASELMYIFGIMDPRVCPFVFAVRRWAKEFKITKSGVGDNFTNFQLSYMALYFLQQLEQPLLPDFKDIMGKSLSKDTKTIVEPSFLRELQQMPFKSKNTSTLSELFVQFLEFYEDFDFSSRMISLKTTEPLSKFDPSPLVLENVFVRDTSWGHNVSEHECNTLKIMIRQTFEELEECNMQPEGAKEKWGLLELFSTLQR